MSLDTVAQEAGVGTECIKIVARWEGCLKKVGPDSYAPYLCPARVPTIGYGTTVYNQVGRKVTMSDPTISKTKAEELLAYDIGKVYAPAVEKYFSKWQHDNQKSACVSFAYNVGHYGFGKSTLCWLLKNGQYDRAANEFMKWTRGGGRTLPGLVNRRRDERKLFLTVTSAKPTYAPRNVPVIPAPSGGENVFRRAFRWVFSR